MVAIGPFDLLTDAQVESSIRVNALHPVYLTKALLPNLMNRQGVKTGIVVTSSGLSGMPMPSVQLYSSTKACVSNFFQSMAFEAADLGIDVMVWEAGPVDTQIVANTEKSCFQSSTRVAVTGCLKDLGKETLTSGIFRHDFQAIGVPFFPLGLLGKSIADKQRAEFLRNQQ